MEIRDIINYEGLYKISNDGNIYTTKRKGTTGGIVKQYKNKTTGYLYIILYKNGIRKSMTVHRLLGLYFIDNPNNYPIIDHIDRDRTNNKIENLRWATYSMNGLNSRSKGGIAIDKFIKNGKEYMYYRVTLNYKNKRFKTNEEAIQYLKEEYDKTE
nr:MAG: hypothetical protein [Lake Baikal virophage 5]